MKEFFWRFRQCSFRLPKTFVKPPCTDNRYLYDHILFHGNQKRCHPFDISSSLPLIRRFIELLFAGFTCQSINPWFLLLHSGSIPLSCWSFRHFSLGVHKHQWPAPSIKILKRQWFKDSKTVEWNAYRTGVRSNKSCTTLQFSIKKITNDDFHQKFDIPRQRSQLWTFHLCHICHRLRV